MKENMFRKLHLQLTCFCTMVTGGIFLALAVICLYFAEYSLEGNDYSAFLRQLNSVLLHLQEQDTISHQWLNQIQDKGQILLYLYDNNEPLYYQSYHNTHEEELRTQEVIKAAREVHQMDIFYASTQQVISHTEFDFCSSSGEEYYVSAGVIPRKNTHLGFIILYSLEKQCREGNRLRIIVCLASFTAVCLLFVFSWFFTKRMIVPLENNRKRQMHFIASASHELRAPLSVVRTGLEALEKTDSPEERRHFLIYMREETERMQHLISDMLLLANADSEHLPLHQERCQPEELLLNVYEKYDSIARNKEIALSVELPEDFLPDCFCDREKIIQVFSILLDNALSYTPAGGKVHLCLRCEKERLCFTFSDTGCGIRDEDKDQIFDRFYRSDDARSDKAHFGLGLCIAKEIVTRHQGTIRVEDSPEGGSCFVVELSVGN